MCIFFCLLAFALAMMEPAMSCMCNSAMLERMATVAVYAVACMYAFLPELVAGEALFEPNRPCASLSAH